MSNFEYKNIEEITKDKFPKRGITIPLEELELLKKQLIVPEFDASNINEFKIELHVFLNNLSYVKSSYDISTYSLIPKIEYPLLQLQVHKDLLELELLPNEYKVVYNFLRNIVGGSDSANNLFISELSQDRTELKLSLANKDSAEGRLELAKFVIENLKPKTFIPPIVLNFGENKVLDVINITSDGDPTSFYVKLYEPLPSDLDIYFVCWVGVKLMKPYIDTVNLIAEQIETSTNYIAGPNFEVDYNYWITPETSYKSWTDILSENIQTSEQLLNRYVSSSGIPVELNIDFTEFQNFIYYSNARDRIENFVYKQELLEFYRSELTRINTITGSIDTNVVKIQLLKDKIISGFDSFEKYLYYNSTGSYNYTYQQSASITPFPKYEISATSSLYHIATKEGKFNFFSSGSNEVMNWTNTVLELADDYDSTNYYALSKSLPDHIREESDNDGAVTFVNMLGHHFDIMFLYTDHILKKNLRQEHPRDGLSQDLIYEATKNMGWTLSHGTSAKDLWEYALGISGSTEPIWTGKTTIDKYLSKTYEERTKEVWRRILNNLSYIYKTKGSARSIKALLSSYGIPQTLLTIREFGGPDNADLGIIPRAEWEKHTYYLNFRGSYPLPTSNHYISVPWDKINGPNGWQYSDAIEFRWKMEPSEFYSYSNDPHQTLLQKNSGSRVDWFVTVNKNGSEDDKGSVTFYIGDGSTYVSASILDEYLYDDVPLNIMIRRSNTNDSVSENLRYDLFLKTNKYGKIAVERSASVVVSGSLIPNTQRAWVSNGILYIGSGSNSQTNKILSGSVFELRYWANQLSEQSFNNHVLSARSYNGNTSTSSFYDLQAQFKFWQPFNIAVTTSLWSSHPDQVKSQFESFPKSASISGFTSASFESIVETYNMEVATVGNNTPFTEKIRIDSGSLIGGLSVDQSSEVSAFDKFSVDSNKLMVAFSPQSIINEDIYESIGNVSIDDYFGEYSNLNADEYPRLKWFAREYWKKYQNKNDFTAYIRLISIFDFSIFDQIRQALPARVNEILGLVIEPNVLERSKVRILKNIEGISSAEIVKTTNEISSSIRSYASTNSHRSTISVGFENDSNVQEIFGDGDVITYIEADNNVNISSDVDIYIHTSANRPQYITIITGSKSQVPIPKQIYFPYKTIISVQSGSIIGDYKQYVANVNSKISSTLESINNTIFDSADIDSSFTITYDRYNVYKSSSINDIGWGHSWLTSSNENGKSTAVFTTIKDYRSDNYYRGYKFFYSSSLELMERRYSSSSFISSSILDPHSLPTSIRNHRFEGCKITGKDVNIDTRDTPDGKAVVEVYFVNSDQVSTDQNMDTNIGGNISAI